MTAVWTSIDPLRYDAGDVNLYRVVFNAPTVYTDPSGLGYGDWWDPRTAAGVVYYMGVQAVNGGMALVTGEAGEALGQRAVDMYEMHSGQAYTGGIGQNLSVAGNIATDFIGINGMAEGIGGADMATGQPLTPLERGGRGAMGFGQIVVTLAVGAKALQGGANAGKAGLQQMRLPPAGGELPPGFRQAFSPARTVCDVLGDGGKSIGTPGINRGVVTVGSEAELRSLFNQLTRGGTEMPPGTYPGTVIKMPDGTFVRLRSESKSGGPTIDITGLCGKSLKVHVK